MGLEDPYFVRNGNNRFGSSVHHPGQLSKRCGFVPDVFKHFIAEHEINRVCCERELRAVVLDRHDCRQRPLPDRLTERLKICVADVDCNHSAGVVGECDRLGTIPTAEIKNALPCKLYEEVCKTGSAAQNLLTVSGRSSQRYVVHA